MVVANQRMVAQTEVFEDIKKMGAFDVSACMNCGVCTVNCPLSVAGNEFPRKLIRYAVLGLDEKLVSHAEPWLCYYCGDCSEQCPSEAEPGEFMMATRRYLTSRYDWTGLSKKLYLSEKWEIGAILSIAMLFLGIFVVANILGISSMEGVDVSINSFAPVEWVHLADIILFVILSFFLLSNAFRMYYYIMFKDPTVKVPLKLYFTEFKAFIHAGLSLITQYRWLECENKTRWLKHLIFVTGYITIFSLVVVFIDIFQVDDTSWNFTSLLGYYATVTILYVSIEAMWSRYKKKEQVHKFSHPTDWLFLILLTLTAITGILIHLFRIMNFAFPSYILYVVHIMIVGPMLIIEVPFGKWSHMLYRPFAVYLSIVKEKARTITGS
jgi:ferredoxin/nitrate reductase gamma subunit